MAEITAALTLDAGPAKATTEQLGASAQQAARAVDGLSASQRELVARSEKLAAIANTIDIQNKKAVASYLQEVAQVRALAAQIGVLNEVQARTAQAAREVSQHVVAEAQQMRALRAEIGATAAASNTLGAATGLTRSGLNSMRASVTSMAASMLGAAPGVTQFTSVLGTMALGSGVMIAVLAGMAALAFAWDKITDSARKAKEENERSLKVLEDFQRQQEQGPGGPIGAEAERQRSNVDADLRKIADLRAQIASLNRGINAGTAEPTDFALRARLQGQLEETQTHYRKLAQLVATGEAEAQRRVAEADQQAKQQGASALAERLAFNQKDAQARRAALDLLAKDRAEYARLLKLPETPDNSAKIAKVAAEMKQLDEALNPKARRASRPQEERDMDAITAALREQEAQAERTAAAKTKAVADAVAATQQELTESELLLAAITESEQAYRDQQREIEVLHILEREGITLADAQYEAERRRVEQLVRNREELERIRETQKRQADETRREADETARALERQAKELHRTVSRTIEGILTDIDQHRNPVVALFDNLKRGAIRAISDILATKIEGKIGDVLGISMPATKQEKAAREMNVAADKMLRAAGAMNDGVPGDGLVDSTTQGGTFQRYAQQFLKIGGAAYGGYQAGYGIGATTQSKPLGAIGGAASGFMLGNAILPGIGGVVGGLAGLAGGIIGAGDAARAAAERLRKAKEAFDTAFAAVKAELAGDDLAVRVAETHARFNDLRNALKDASPQLGITSLRLNDFAEKLKDLGATEEEYIARLEREAAIKARRTIEDYQQRLAEATPGNDRQEAIDRFNREKDRELEDLYNSFGSVVDANEQATYAIAQQAIAAEKEKFAREQATAALDAFTSSLHNAPTGFKVEPYTFAYGTPAARPRSGFSPSAPNAPLSPLAPATLSSASKSVNVTFNIDGTKTTRTQVQQIAVELKKVVTETLGTDADVADGWGLLA